jgi:signal transduction histidine kinase
VSSTAFRVRIGSVKRQTWPVFLLGLSSLLGLILVPGTAAIQKAQSLYEQFRLIQEKYDANSRRLQDLGNRMFGTSLLIREFLLDSAADGADYHQRFDKEREGVQNLIVQLSQTLRPGDQVIVERLEDRLRQYWESREEVFEWSPEERLARGTFYLRESGAPNRGSIMQLASEVERLNRSNYLLQLEGIEKSQQELRQSVERIMWLAIFAGILIAGGSVARIWLLERRAGQQRERLRGLSAQLMRAQEEERRAISRELHDEVGQMVTGLKMELATLTRLRTSDPEEFSSHVAEAKRLADETLRTVRSIAVGLRPSVLELGLAPALEWLVRDVGKHTDMRIDLRTTGELEALPEKHRVFIYRVIQEALNNSVRHARASNVEVNVLGENGKVDLEIRDDGIGFVEKQSAGLGLAGIEERIRELGGSFEIDGAPGHGTRLRASVSVT